MGPGRCFTRADGRHTDALQAGAGNYSLLTCVGIVASAWAMVKPRSPALAALG